MRAAKVDANQKAIVEALRAEGCTVQSLAAVGKGVPDLLVGYEGRNYLFEVKMPKGELTDDQVIWHRGWAGEVHVVRDYADAFGILGITIF